ncbi:MAG: segregation/condensation protein A [Bacteriovoracaceae bacterium]|jgi:segregation and condensation protein A|nr:segregation/condensation protein A [Bacteriovoracaceae bacterium]
MIENNIQVKLDRFDGPLALLLHLIQREQMSIRELDINQITDEYLLYLQKMQNINFDIAGEYLYMAATLLFIKSKSIAEDEEKATLDLNKENLIVTTKTQLIEKLEELQKFQMLGERLFSLPKRNEDIFVKPKVDRKAIQNSILTPMSLETLTDSMIDLMRREKRKYTVVKRDRLSIKEKLRELKTNLQVGSNTTLNTLINDKSSIEETVITFISLLELARLKKLNIFQNEVMGEVYVDVVDSLESFDVETADGFEPEDAPAKINTEDLAPVENSASI